ncbi:hypothetical protein ACFXAF_13785 [Kitasatospora sp. NPDC059463]|uniref:hypothetical protein n=1 Tax=unclassified Kitasatospora TaxID=2633591 RepID=UPI00369C1DB2
MTLDSTPAARRHEAALEKLAVLRARPDLQEDPPAWAPARRLWDGAEVLSKVMDASTRSPGGDEPAIATDDLAAALALFEDLRQQLDHLECQVIMEARRHGMDWNQIKDQQSLKTPQAAAQRYQRLMTRLEEIRQGMR